MNRETAYRGKRVDNGEWVYGAALTDKSGSFIWADKRVPHQEYGWIPVIPSTVGEWTGITTDGTKVYEDDIDRYGRVVIWSKRGTRFAYHSIGQNSYGGQRKTLKTIIDFEPVGTIHDTEDQAK